MVAVGEQRSVRAISENARGVDALVALEYGRLSHVLEVMTVGTADAAVAAGADTADAADEHQEAADKQRE